MVEKFEVSREDEIYESWPDVTRTPSGGLVCVFEELTHHGDPGYSRIMMTSSNDRGRTWTDKKPLSDIQRTESEENFYWDCPRIVTLNDDRLAVVVSLHVRNTDYRTPDDQKILMWTSNDEGESWEGPRTLPVYGSVPDQLIELEHGEHEGRWILTTHDENIWKIQSWYSDDQGETWHGPETVAISPGYQLCEGSVVHLPNDKLVCFIRENSGDGLDAFKSISEDGGETWDGPFEMPLPGAHRPVAGMLNSGKVLITYRFSQGGKGWLGNWTQNTFAAVTDVESCVARTRDEAATRILPLDYDRSSNADTGYTGWAQFPDGEIYVVNYIVDDAPPKTVREPGMTGEYDDAPKAYIRGYSFYEEEFIYDEQ